MRFALVVVVVGCSKSSPDVPAVKPPPASPPSRDAAARCSPHTGNPDPKLGGCKADAECKDGSNGFCKGGWSNGHDRAENRCAYDSCVTDADCERATACLCGGGGNGCVDARCRSSADCGGNPCTLDTGCRGTPSGFVCHSADDECSSSRDCGDKPGTDCDYSRELEHWACVDLKCPVG